MERRLVKGPRLAASLAASLAWLACSARPVAAPPERGAATVAAVPVDHHVHILSPELVRDWKSLGVPFSKPDSAYVSAAPLLGAERVGRAVLLPMAHLYGRREFREALGLSEAEEYEAVRRENDHVAREAERWPGRAVAFCSVDFRRPYAWEEIHRCHRELGSAGIKLHLASAGADLRDGGQLARLARIAAWAEEEGLALTIHFDPQRRGLEVEDVERFIDEVLAPVPELVVCIAHLGGSGGYGGWTRSVYRTFRRWLDEEAARGVARSGVFFDIAGVWLEEESEGVPPSTEEDVAALRDDLERWGLERLVFGSDYPVFDPPAYAGALRGVLGLSPSGWEDLIHHEMPVFDEAPAVAGRDPGLPR